MSAYLSGASKKVGVLAIFLVFIGPILYFGPGSGNLFSGGPVDLGPILRIAFAVLAVLTMTFGNILALLQKEMKRMLAYSSISQAGYILLGIAIGTAPALAGATLQVFAHVFMKTGAFLVVAAAAGVGIGPLIDDWKGVGSRRPLFAVAFALMLLSLAGVPLTIGFVSKFVLFSAAVQAQGYYVWLAVAGLLNSALSLFYYGRVLKVMFFDTPAPGVDPRGSGRRGGRPSDPRIRWARLRPRGRDRRRRGRDRRPRSVPAAVPWGDPERGEPLPGHRGVSPWSGSTSPWSAADRPGRSRPVRRPKEGPARSSSITVARSDSRCSAESSCRPAPSSPTCSTARR